MKSKEEGGGNPEQKRGDGDSRAEAEPAGRATGWCLGGGGGDGAAGAPRPGPGLQRESFLEEAGSCEWGRGSCGGGGLLRGPVLPA